MERKLAETRSGFKPEDTNAYTGSPIERLLYGEPALPEIDNNR